MDAPNDCLGLDAPGVWDFKRATQQLRALGQALTARTAARRLQGLNLLPPELGADGIRDERGHPPNRLILDWTMQQARSQRRLLLFAQLHELPGGRPCLHANDARGARYWLPLDPSPDASALSGALGRLQRHIGKPVVVIAHGALAGWLRDAASPEGVTLPAGLYEPVLDPDTWVARPRQAVAPQLRRLEAESIHILREAVAEAENPVMTYSIGKDSAVMLHLARKAFYPSRPPFPLLHIDTRWKFREMYLMRDHIARESGMQMIVHINPEAIAKDINPFDHGSALHTEITKTEGLRQALDHHRFDVIFGGARRDEEKSRAKERIFSFRTASHRWDPKNQRPELWNLYNTERNPGESIRVFPLSNWTELDVWQYIAQEHIPVVPLYFARRRPVVRRDGLILVVDDSRFRLLPGETITEDVVRFRTLGCYPLTGAVESSASSLQEIILELVNARVSERQGRAIDSDASASMEKKKQGGYF
jgi:sulfate adenylyltransferase subunit 2